LTESWVDKQVFCPNCGLLKVSEYENNRPVADFFCSNCGEDYELKSKNGAIGNKIVDGAYATMIQRLGDTNNPNFFFLTYSRQEYKVNNFLVIPKHFFTTEVVEKRKPLALTAKRAGWVGCNILLNHIPQSGKVHYIKNGSVVSKNKVLESWKKTIFLRETKDVTSRGWIIDIMQCIDTVGKRDFSLDEMYAFENKLSSLHPENKHVKEKIRQQLQVLRDKGYLDFTTRGQYHLI
jgi:type II restriction enzyme